MEVLLANEFGKTDVIKDVVEIYPISNKYLRVVTIDNEDTVELSHVKEIITSETAEWKFVGIEKWKHTSLVENDFCAKDIIYECSNCGARLITSVAGKLDGTDLPLYMEQKLKNEFKVCPHCHSFMTTIEELGKW